MSRSREPPSGTDGASRRRWRPTVHWDLEPLVDGNATSGGRVAGRGSRGAEELQRFRGRLGTLDAEGLAEAMHEVAAGTESARRAGPTPAAVRSTPLIPRAAIVAGGGAAPRSPTSCCSSSSSGRRCPTTRRRVSSRRRPLVLPAHLEVGAALPAPLLSGGPRAGAGRQGGHRAVRGRDCSASLTSAITVESTAESRSLEPGCRSCSRPTGAGARPRPRRSPSGSRRACGHGRSVQTPCWPTRRATTGSTFDHWWRPQPRQRGRATIVAALVDAVTALRHPQRCTR